MAAAAGTGTVTGAVTARLSIKERGSVGTHCPESLAPQRRDGGGGGGGGEDSAGSPVGRIMVLRGPAGRWSSQDHSLPAVSQGSRRR